MMPATDYRIYQRNSEGYAEILLEGILPENVENVNVYTRVCREDDNLTVIPWTQGMLSDRKWQITLNVPQGGLYRMETCAAPIQTGTEKLEWKQRIQNICHVGVGELFMLAGQSNMAGYGRDMAYDPPQLGVHLYGNNGKWSIATHPLNDSCDTIYPENRELASGVSPMLSFARQIQRALNVPVGLVQASLGGSKLRRWDLEEDGTLTCAMLRRLDATGPVGAIVWYQGCSDADDDACKTYLSRFERTVRQWRDRMGEIPIVTVQLNRHEAADQSDYGWGMVREAQRQAARRIPGVCIVSSIDLPTSDGVHNSSGSNVILGERMASVYLRSRYGLPGLITPDIESVRRIDASHLCVTLTEGSDIVVISTTGEGFHAEDEQGLIPCVNASGRDNTILLELARPLSSPACLHALWQYKTTAFPPRSRYGMPMLSCYGVPILP